MKNFIELEISNEPYFMNSKNIMINLDSISTVASHDTGLMHKARSKITVGSSVFYSKLSYGQLKKLVVDENTAEVYSFKTSDVDSLKRDNEPTNLSEEFKQLDWS